MKQYEFSDCLYNAETNIETECDINGDNYREFIRICCKYCAVVSFVFTPYAGCNSDVKLKKTLAPFCIKRPDNITSFSSTYEGKASDEELNVKYYRVCDELCEILFNSASSIFEWLQGWGYINPENPAFYRADGSVFFTSVIHEGWLKLTPRDDEDVSQIVSVTGWKLIN